MCVLCMYEYEREMEKRDGMGIVVGSLWPRYSLVIASYSLFSFPLIKQ
jgi:hypothetical protein